MAGNRAGGQKAAKKNKARYDELYAEYGGFYGYIGRKGGAKSTGGGFAQDRKLASEAGRKGGMASRRTKAY